MTSASAPQRLFLVVLTGALLLQTAWILAMPAFRGSDEFDHVYKAEAVAHGQLLDDGAAENGRGGLVRVSADVVAAASAMCSSYVYTGPDNCHPVEPAGGGLVRVASGASAYNPTYYAVVGLMARPFEGAATDFAIRAYTAVLAALLLAWAAVVTSGWARNGWPLLALLVTATPVLVHSTAMASPNGVGYAAACLVWAASLGLVEDPGRPRLVALTTAALTMMVTHSTGVMWLAFVLVIIVLLQPLGRWRALYHRSGRAMSSAAAVVALGAFACVAWILLAKPNSLDPGGNATTPLGLADLVSGQVVWTLQTIAAFPLRNEPAPVVVYVLWLLPFAGMLAAGIRVATPRVRLGTLLLLGVWVAVPVALTLLSYASQGLAWQGRYALPLAVGFPALAGLALHRTSRGPSRFHCTVIVALCAVAQTISCAAVAWQEKDAGYSATFVTGVTGVPGVGVVTVLALAGSLLPLLLTRRMGAQNSGTDSGIGPVVPAARGLARYLGP